MPLSKILMCFLFFAIGLINISYAASQANVALSVDIEPEYSIVSAGDRMIIQINLIQLGDQRRKDVTLSLSLIDNQGKAIYKSTETIALETRASLVSKLNVPENANNGIYNIDVKILDVKGENLIAQASKEIIIEKTKITRTEIYLIGIYLIVISLFIIMIILYKRNRAFIKISKQKVTKQDIQKYLMRRRNKP